MPKLTKSYIENLETFHKPLIVWDQGSGNISGFCVQVYPSGKKTYYYIYRSKGDSKKKRIQLGIHGQITCEQARELAKTYTADIAHRIDPKIKEQKENKEEENSKNILFKDFLSIFIEKHSNLYNKPNTLRVNEYQFNAHLLPFFGDKKIDFITRDEIFKFKDYLRESPSTYNRCIALLNCLFNKSILWGYKKSSHNPCYGICKYTEKKRERFLENDELTQLIKILDIQKHTRFESPYVIDALKMLIYTGCRKSEILTLKWSDVQLDQNCIHLKDSKTGEKIVPLNSLSKGVLETIERQEGNPYVFCGKIPGTHLVDIKKTWDRLRTQLNMQEVRIHDLRHTFASMAIKSGASLFQVSKLLGHKKIETTMRYAHTNREELVKSAKAVESVFMQVHP